MATHDDVRRIVLALPEVCEGTEGFGFGVTDRGKVKGIVWLWRERVHPKKPKVPNPDVLAVPVPGLGAKEVLLASNPAIYFTEPHYDGYAAVLIRLEAIDVDELRDLLTEAWRTKAPRALVRHASVNLKHRTKSGMLRFGGCRSDARTGRRSFQKRDEANGDD